MLGKFIVFYGVNGLGKTTQAKKLVSFLIRKGLKAEYVKYPIYDLESGKIINEILRGGKKQEMTELSLQMIYTVNRFEFQSTLKEKLDSGINVVSEDYRGTGLSWSKAKGISKKDYDILDRINNQLLPEDIVFLFDGIPFSTAIEKNHLHESNSELMKISRKAHLEVGREKGWALIDANQTQEEVFGDIIKILRKSFNL
jgi:dTMP kinase